MARRLLLAGLLAVAGLAVAASPAGADSGWTLSGFAADIRVNPDGSIAVTESIEANFGSLAKHGIYRDIPTRYPYDQKYDRVLRLSGVSVADGSGHAIPWTESRNGAAEELRIGDPNRTVSGLQSYLIRYTVEGAFNGFADHDELYWNATGTYWPVPIQRAAATIRAPAGSIQRATCYEGLPGSTAPCQVETGGDNVAFSATRALDRGEGLTVVAALAKGTVPEPAPILEARPRSFSEMFAPTVTDLAGLGAVLAAGIGLLAWMWWRTGRDREYRNAYYLNHDPTTPDEIAPLSGHRPVVVEFGPPDDLRPAQLGLILDEHPDKKDVTATIIDLAARGYLKISELAGQGHFGRPDYQLTQAQPVPDVAQLQVFERTVYYGLFPQGRSQVKLSELKGTFAMTLARAENDLVSDAMQRRWFPHRPTMVRLLWIVAGVVTLFVGAALALVLGQLTGDGLVGVGLMIVGALAIIFSGAMPARTAIGHDVLYRTLGFRLYMTTAERYQQQFAEREKIFTAFLPFAIVFGCVDRWAHAFSDIDVTAATSGWYVGPAGLNALLLSSSLQGFSSAVSTSMVATSASSGSSGFGGGGFSGGGFGGGGGGSW